MSNIFKDFEKKNEVLKVKIPKFATGGICNDVIFPKFDMFPEIDEIVKDIRKQKDNAMAMEFTKCIGELLRKNGVVPKMTEYTHENVRENSIEHRYGVSITELDFFEHDKVFEDKIASLEKQIERLMREKQLAYDRSEQLMKTTDVINSANKELKQEKLDKNEKIAELACENESLKQRIEDIAKDRDEWIDKAVEWKRKCEKLESKNNQLTESILRKETKIHELESSEAVDLPFDPLECANYLINATYERETNGIERAFHNLPDKVNSDRYTVDDLEQIAEHLLVYCKHNKESE